MHTCILIILHNIGIGCIILCLWGSIGFTPGCHSLEKNVGDQYWPKYNLIGPIPNKTTRQDINSIQSLEFFVQKKTIMIIQKV